MLTDAFGTPLPDGLQRGSDLWNSKYALMVNSHPPEVAEEKTVSCMIAMAGIFDKYLQERDSGD